MNSTLAAFFSFGLAGSLWAQTPANVSTLPPSPPTLPTPIRIVPAAERSIPLHTHRSLPTAATPKTPGLIWNSENQTYESKPGEMSAPFVFAFSNASPAQIIIQSTSTSCGCTAAQLPVQPWPIDPGATGEIKVAMNLAGKTGSITKQVTVNTSEGNKVLLVTTKISPPAPAENLRGDRNENIQTALADRQAVFKGDCRSCHVDPGVGKAGKDLYVVSCGICHDTPNRAPMVPDLRAPKGPRDNSYWHNWITHGRPGSLMPAFGEQDGGPLSKEQIASLVAYLMENFPKGTPFAPVAPTPAIAPIVPTAPASPAASGGGQ